MPILKNDLTKLSPFEIIAETRLWHFLAKLQSNRAANRGAILGVSPSIKVVCAYFSINGWAIEHSQFAKPLELDQTRFISKVVFENMIWKYADSILTNAHFQNSRGTFDNVNPDKDVVTFDLQSYKTHEL